MNYFASVMFWLDPSVNYWRDTNIGTQNGFTIKPGFILAFSPLTLNLFFIVTMWFISTCLYMYILNNFICFFFYGIVLTSNIINMKNFKWISNERFCMTCTVVDICMLFSMLYFREIFQIIKKENMPLGCCLEKMQPINMLLVSKYMNL